jgi:hypothetical protein
VQLLDIGLVEVELGDCRRHLTIGERAELPAAGDQRPDLFEFCELWARHQASDDLLLCPLSWPRGRKRGRPDERSWFQQRTAGPARHHVHVDGPLSTSRREASSVVSPLSDIQNHPVNVW